MTINVIQKFLENMKISVPMIVTIPEKSWVNPSSIPSDRISVSAIIRLMISPVLCPSKVREGKYLNVSDGFGTDILYCLVGHAVIDHIHKPRGSRREG